MALKYEVIRMWAFADGPGWNHLQTSPGDALVCTLHMTVTSGKVSIPLVSSRVTDLSAAPSAAFTQQ